MEGKQGLCRVKLLPCPPQALSPPDQPWGPSTGCLAALTSRTIAYFSTYIEQGEQSTDPAESGPHRPADQAFKI